jgi:hypothetical protein
MEKTELVEVAGLLVDPRPDERGNVMIAALMTDERLVSLTANAN